MASQEQLRVQGLLSLGKGHIQGNLAAATQNLQRGYSEDGVKFFIVLHGRSMADNGITLKMLFTGKEKTSHTYKAKNLLVV